MINKRLTPVALLLLFTWTSAHAETKIAGIFGDSMVLQRDASLPVWGWGQPGEKITVSILDQTHDTTAGADGKWSVKLNPLKAGGPLELKVSGTTEIVVKDILVGEVWLCSGQSNMAMTVSRSKDFNIEKGKADLPKIRHFKTKAHATPEAQADCDGTWAICNADTVGSFSATAYFFGRKLHEELGVPIGLINSSWGGTDVAAWTSLSAQKAQEDIVPKLDAYDKILAAYDTGKAKAAYDKALASWEARRAAATKAGKRAPRKPSLANPINNQNRPANLFNGMIHPLVPFGMRGAIWYQGERNSKSIADGILYGTQLNTLITDWRTRWGQGDFPFITVQLPNFKAAVDSPVQTTGWVMVRESEMKTLQLKNTGIAITTDVGDAKDIHPKNKQAVGMRLALWALGTTYGQAIPYSGPIMAFNQYRGGTEDDDGNIIKPGRMMISFQHAKGLTTSDKKPIRGFAVADEDKTFHAATAKYDPKTGMVVLQSDKVYLPVAARYNWADNPNGNLINAAGLPAAPFRTDNWDVTQE